MILEYKDIPIFYTNQGEGGAVVLLHGFLETSSMWKHLIPEIESQHNIIAIDLLGHGQTGCLGYIHTMELMAEAVAFVLDYLKVEKFFVIGHSMGGYVALALAESFPQRIKGLCLLNSTPFADSPERQSNRDRAIKAVKYNPQSFITMAIANLFGPEKVSQFAEEIELIKLEAMSLSLQGIIAALEGMKIRKDRSHVLEQLDAHKMVFLGRNDPVLEYVILKSKFDALGIDSVDFEGGHMTYIENIREFTYKLKRFIEK